MAYCLKVKMMNNNKNDIIVEAEELRSISATRPLLSVYYSD